MAATKYLDYDGLLYFWTLIKAKLALKADAQSVTAGSYGPSSNASPAHSGTFKVPTIQVTSQGVITSISEKTITLPADNNTDTLVTQNVSTANEEHPILLTVTKDASANQGAKTSIFAAGVKVNPSTGTITATKFSGAVQGKATDADHADEADVADKVANDLVLKIKTGTSEGTSLYTYNGSAGKTLDIKQGSNITLTAAANSLTIAGVGDTKNTAGSTDSSSKLFLIGATSQATNPQTYSHDTAYVGTDGCLYSGGTKVLTAHQDISGKADDSSVVHLTGNEIISGVKTFNTLSITGSGNLIKSTNTAEMAVCGGTAASAASGAFLQLYGSARSDAPGTFLIYAGTSSSNYTRMIGKPDGTLTWGGQTIQTSSDERIKTSLHAVPNAVLDAWEAVQWGEFQFLDAVQRKGESARLHLGLIAQRVKAVFEDRGLDACEYGILCYEEEEDLWMVRYTEALAMEAAYQRRKANRLEARIAVLEAKLL